MFNFKKSRLILEKVIKDLEKYPLVEWEKESNVMELPNFELKYKIFYEDYFLFFREAWVHGFHDEMSFFDRIRLGKIINSFLKEENRKEEEYKLNQFLTK